MLRTLGADVRPCPVVAWSDDNNYNHQVSNKYTVAVSLCALLSFIFEPPHDKTNKVAVCPAKTQISLGICPV